MANGINHFCRIEKGQVILDDKIIFSNKKASTFDVFIKSVYKAFKMDYPKFYKMDPLCKLALIATSILLDDKGEQVEEDMALILSNKSSCVDVDLKHQSTINDKDSYYPSPANFVYTLPNIALGEISIKYKLRSENSFFIFEDFNPEFMVNYSESLIRLKKASTALCAWVDVYEDNYKAFVYEVLPNGKTENSVANLLTMIE
ncbi:MAG: 3-oxoacyl-ACP synthase [Brumimicrobium sp.]